MVCVVFFLRMFHCVSFVTMAEVVGLWHGRIVWNPIFLAVSAIFSVTTNSGLESKSWYWYCVIACCRCRRLLWLWTVIASICWMSLQDNWNVSFVAK